MKLYLQVLKLLFNKFILRKSNGLVVKEFCEKMGITYIKFAQILATQNYGNLFTEEDRRELSSICDNCNPITYREIEEILKQEYGQDLDNIFEFIDEEPVGSASVSQVHRGILKNGKEVAIKIKRKDVAKTICQDIEKIRRFMHLFGFVINFKNYLGGDFALDLYFDWIKEEIDFALEKSNIETYQSFASMVNGKIKNTKKVRIPNVYPEYSTENVIVMDFVKASTINKIALTEENKAKINEAINSYIKLSFWALFNDKQVTFHGDPHTGNVCVDDHGDIWFLDMGLITVLSPEEANLCREFFLTVYMGDYEKLYNMLIKYGNLNEQEKASFKEDCKRYCLKNKNRILTTFFTDMIEVLFNYELKPPVFLFRMCKTFLCLNGMNNFLKNEISATSLLQNQVIGYLIKRGINDYKQVARDIIRMSPRLIKTTIEEGAISAASVLATDDTLISDIRTTLNNMQEVLKIIKLSSKIPRVESEEPPNNEGRSRKRTF